MLVSQKTRLRLSSIVDDLHALLLITLFGEGAVLPETVDRLKRRGYTWPAKPMNTPKDAFTFGLLAEKLRKNGKPVPLTWKQFKEFTKENPSPLSLEEQAGVKHIEDSFAFYVQNLAQTANSTTSGILLGANKKLRQKLESAMKKEIIAGIEKHKTVQEVAEALKQATQGYATDFMRIAETELNNAYQEGRRYGIRSRNPKKDPLVYKIVRPDGCKECLAAYTVDGKKPRLFRLSELEANGSNIGVPKKHRQPVIESLHPHCRCMLFELPDGFKLTKDGRMVPK